MAHTHNAVAVVPVVAVDSNQDVEFSHRAAALLVRLKPCLDPEKVVHELLSQQRLEKLARESRGLNHWREHAPRFLAQVVRQARQDRLRRFQEAAVFYKAKHHEIVRFVRAIVGDSEAAEAVASDTYRELLEGSITIAGFFAAAVANARNYLARQSYRRGRFVPQDEAFTPSFGSAGTESDEVGILSLEPISHRLEDQDPLEILIAREDEEGRLREIAKARTIAMGTRKYRWVRAKNWARDLDLKATA